MYTAPVPTQTHSREVATAVAVAGAAAMLWGLQLFSEYMTSASGPSGTLILTVIAGGFALSFVGLVVSSRRSSRSQRRQISAVLLVVGALTFCVALLGHVLGAFFAIAIPSLLLGVVVRLVPGTKPAS
jgi:small neutral amino acid transporter SnatA (MarC family)